MPRYRRPGRSSLDGVRAWFGYHLETFWLLGLLAGAVALGALVVKL